MRRLLNAAVRILAGLLLVCGAFGAVAGILALAAREPMAPALLVFSLMGIEAAVLLCRLSRPLRVPRLLITLRSGGLRLLRFWLVLGTAGAIVQLLNGRVRDLRDVAVPLAGVVVWFVVWRRTRPPAESRAV